MRRNIIEIYSTADPARPHKVFFKDRTGKEVFAYVDEPQSLLNMRQKEAFFMGSFTFSVNDSDIKDLEKLLNFPV